MYDHTLHLKLMVQTNDYVKFKSYERKTKSPFIMYSDFEVILIPDNNGRQNPDESNTNKYQIGCQLLCVEKDAICNFINSMIEKSKYCVGVLKKHFNKELAMTKEDDEEFENSMKCWIWDHVYV